MKLDMETIQHATSGLIFNNQYFSPKNINTLKIITIPGGIEVFPIWLVGNSDPLGNISYKLQLAYKERTIMTWNVHPQNVYFYPVEPLTRTLIDEERMIRRSDLYVSIKFPIPITTENGNSLVRPISYLGFVLAKHNIMDNL